MVTEKEKKLWNEAVKATLREVNKFDGFIPAQSDRAYLIKKVSERVMYKLKPTGA